MKIALIGYGAMGKEVEKMAKEKGVDVVATIDPQAPGATHKEISLEALKDADVCIDFTAPGVVIDNVKAISALGKDMVIATTGWYDRMKEMQSIVEKSGNGVVWGSNFSVGVNMFFRIVRSAAKLVDKLPDYDIMGYELHHRRKVDSPSGTANTIANLLVEEIGRKTAVQPDKLDRRIMPEELHFASVRGGDIPGTHVVLLDSSADTIELKHTARTRAGFALGAVLAASWIHGKKGFYSADHMMQDFFGGAKDV